MKIKSFLLIHVLAASVLLASHSVFAAPDSDAEQEQIAHAMQLYSEASALEVHSPEKAELLKRAEGILTAVLEQNPGSLDAHRKLMGVYLQQRDYTRAIRTMQNAITLSPEDPKLFVALAILYDHSGAYEQANAMLDQALTLDPDMQIARDYKSSLQLKIDMQQAGTEPHGDDPAK